MKVILFLVSLIIYEVFADTETSIQKQWLEFKATYNKTYTSQEEEAKRYGIFKKNLYSIERHNKKYSRKDVAYRRAVNKFADWTKVEFAAYAKIDGGLGKPPHGDKSQSYVLPENKTLTLPFQIDWRDRGVVGKVKNQGQCGSCWSFSAIGAIESQLAIKEGRFTPLSEQHLVDCSDDYDNEGCSGGWSHWAFDYVIDNGVVTEDSYPYTGKDGECRNDSTSVTKIKGYYALPAGSEAWLQYFVGTMGPVSVSIDATVDLQFYASGVFKDLTCTSHYVNHAVLVVGYGVDERGNDYWIVKNSWGTEWGQKGYFHLARNAGSMCSVAAAGLFPFL